MGKLGFWDCFLLLIGAMVGSAIFSLSGLTILTSGPAALLSWLIAALIMLGYGLCMGELACTYPKSGGIYYFPRLAFAGKTGEWLGWISCWSCILTNIAAIAFSAIYTGIYLSVAFPWAVGKQLPIALLSVLFSLLLNLLQVKVAGKIHALLVLALLAAMGIYLYAAFFETSFDFGMLIPVFSQGCDGKTGFLSAVPTALIGYSGITALAFMASDVRKPGKNIPLSMYFSILFVALLYALMILATLGLVNSSMLQKHPEFRFIPIFYACFTKLGAFPYLGGVVSIAAVLALMTTMNVCVSLNARALQAAGEDGSLPRCFGETVGCRVPRFSVFVTCLAAMIYCCFPEYTQQIVNFGAVFNILGMVLTMFALIQTRKQRKRRSFIAPGGKWLLGSVLLLLLFCHATGLWQKGSFLWLYTAGFLLLGAGIKWISGKFRASHQ